MIIKIGCMKFIRISMNCLFVLFVLFGSLFGGQDIQLDPNDFVLQDDGKLIVVGNYKNGRAKQSFIARYDSQGILDNSFGVNGYAFMQIGDDSLAESVTLQSDGKILVAGSVNISSVRYFLLMRLTSSGILDTSFGGGSGYVSTLIGDSSGAVSLVLENSGNRIILFGSATVSAIPYFALACYVNDGVNDGTLDGSYGIGGIVLESSLVYSQASSMAIQSDNKVLVCGSLLIDGAPIFLLIRYTTSGGFDDTFNETGIVTMDFDHKDRFVSLALQSDGKIIVAGRSGGQNSVLARYTEVGVLDSTFNGTGIVETSLAGLSMIAGIALDDVGNILATGCDLDRNLISVRYTQSGTLDTTFGSSGSLGFPDLGKVFGRNILVQSNGKIINLAKAKSGVIALRYSEAGTVDTIYGIKKSYESMVCGSITGSTKTSAGDVFQDLAWAAQKLQYVPRFGGVTFTYPDNLFSEAPRVSVTLEYHGSTKKKSVYSVVTENSASSTTVYVAEGRNNKSFDEPDSGDVVVHIYSVGEPAV